MPKKIQLEETTRKDPMDRQQRSAQMAKVRSIGNKSTEAVVESALKEADLRDWEKHPQNILGKPDFFFPHYKLVIFVNGCFWHCCHICKRPVPRSEYWKNKIDGNRRRDNRIHKILRQEGYHVMRIWEHELKDQFWLKRLDAMFKRIDKKTYQ